MKHGWNHAFFPKPVGKKDHHISPMKQIAYGCFLFAKNIQAQFRFRQRFHKYVLVNYVPGICVVPSSSPREMTVNSDWGVSLLIQWQWSCANVGTSLYPRTQSLHCACWLDEIVPDRWWKGTKTPGTCVYRRLLSHVVSLLGSLPLINGALALVSTVSPLYKSTQIALKLPRLRRLQPK